LSLDPDKTDFTGSISIQLAVRKPVQTIWLNAKKIAVQDAWLTADSRRMNAKILPGGDDYVGFQFMPRFPWEPRNCTYPIAASSGRTLPASSTPRTEATPIS
jgi:hypothetical protein